MTSCKSFRHREFRCTNWGCKTNDPAAFGKPRWRGCNEVVFLILHRLIWPLFFICLLLSEFIRGRLVAESLVFLSIQAFVIVAFSLILSFFVTLFTITGHLGKTWNHFLGFHWVIHNLAAYLSGIVTIVYWALLYPPVKHLVVFEVRTIPIHGLNLLYFYLDIWLGKTPIRFYHFIHGLAYLVLYVIFIAVFIEAGGFPGRTYVYAIVDFVNKPGMSTAYSFGLGFLATAMWTVYYGMHVLASYVEHKTSKTAVGPFLDEDNAEELDLSPPEKEQKV